MGLLVIAGMFAMSLGAGVLAWLLIRLVPRERSLGMKIVFLTAAAFAGLASLWLGVCGASIMKMNRMI